ncbi:MAG: hypothetical protein L6R37_004924 [Teloschistes peruensis]|nr:MAG: hypothetical protein L6R37_004924 [Teloschistes peruensis]
MAPKPFPYLIRQGVDICRVSRVSKILEKPSHELLRWALKIFTRQEWPQLWRQFNEATVKQEALGSQAQLFLPKLTLSASQHAHGPLAQYIAGRWAAKEATIKAHQRRRLFMRDVSIVPQDNPLLKPQERCTSRVHALVAPENLKRIVMDPEVAKKRGLSSSTSPEYTVSGNIEDGQFVQKPESATQDNHPALRLQSRRVRMTDREQQIAEISISHEAEYAVAVCMALDDPTSPRADVGYIVDDGTGEPLHEPIWGDAEWLVEQVPEAAGHGDG